MLNLAAEMYVLGRMVAGYFAVLLIVVGIVAFIVYRIQMRRNSSPIIVFLNNPDFAKSCLNNVEWCKKNPKLSKQLKEKMKDDL